MNPLDVRPDNIDSYRQNLPVLVAQDLQEHFDVPLEATAKILLARGVMKWLACRRDIIEMKDGWRRKISAIQLVLGVARSYWASPDALSNASIGKHGIRPTAWWKGYAAALQDCRKEVRAICHSNRWRAPDIDRWSSWYIEELAKGAGDGISPVLSDRSVSIPEIPAGGGIHPDAREGVLDGVQVVAEALDTAQVEG